MPPYIGDERPEWTTGLCGYAPKPGDLECNADVEWHGLLFDEAGELQSMGCCDAHLPIMKAVSDYVHRHQHPCGIPGSMFRWPENYCYTDWDEAELTSAAQLVTAGMENA
jgi:hypothetical protein